MRIEALDYVVDYELLLSGVIPELGSPDRPLLVPGWIVNRFGVVPIDATLQQMGIRYWVRVDETEWDDVRS